LYGGEDYAGLLPQAYELSQQPMQQPDYMVAGRTPTQVAAEQMAQQARGSYEPALAAGEALTGQGVMATEQAGRLSQQELGASQLERQAARAALSGALSGTAAAGMTGADLSEAQRYSSGATQLGMGLLGEAYDLNRAVPGMALSAAERGIAGFEGTGAEYDPSSVANYMNPYEQQVIDRAMQDVARSGQTQLNEARAQAVRSGAFGGARMGLAEAEIGRNILGEQARTASNLRQQGFESAAQRSQAAFEQAQGRQQAAASSIGQLGLSGAGQVASGIGQLANIGSSAGQLGQAGAGQLANMQTTASQTGLAAAGQAAQIGSAVGALGTDYGQLGQQAAGQQAQFGQGLGALGAQMAGFGQQRQGQQLQDINTALTIGQQQQGQEQAYLDAARQNQYQATMAPYQQLGFFSDIFQGAPTGTSAVVQQQQPGPNPVSQAAGLGLGAYGLAQSGLFS
jgi:hypothetical protein